MTDQVRLEPLPTPFAPPSERVTVATPSCCCCCCCLVTISAATAFTATEANLQAERHGGNRVLATILGLLAIPSSAFAGFSIAERTSDGQLVWVAFAVIIFLAIWGAFLVTKAPPGRAAAVAGGVVVFGGMAMVVEFFAALMSLFLFELLVPFGIWAGIAMGRAGKEVAPRSGAPGLPPGLTPPTYSYPPVPAGPPPPPPPSFSPAPPSPPPPPSPTPPGPPLADEADPPPIP